MKRSYLFVACAGLGLALAASASNLGPPGICSPIDCGDRASQVDTAWAKVTRRNAPTELPGVLDALSDSTIARMEVLRRVAMTEKIDADAVVGALALRALEKDGAKDAAGALFDAGYAIHLFKTLGRDDWNKTAAKDGVAGYAFVVRAIEKGGDAGMHVGAAYMTLPAMQPRDDARIARARTLFNAHCEAAIRACTAGSPEERNLAFVLEFENQKVDALRARLSER